jgi:hypothetical protein
VQVVRTEGAKGVYGETVSEIGAVNLSIVIADSSKDIL